MFCNAFHPDGCLCCLCAAVRGISKKAAYRQSLARAKALGYDTGGRTVRRPVPGQVYGFKEAPMLDEEFKKKFPHLLEWLTSTEYDDRKLRTTSTLLLFVENGVLKVCFNDRDNNRSVFVSNTTVEGALYDLDIGLANDTLEWKRRNSGSGVDTRPPF